MRACVVRTDKMWSFLLVFFFVCGEREGEGCVKVLQKADKSVEEELHVKIKTMPTEHKRDKDRSRCWRKVRWQWQALEMTGGRN